MINPFIFHILGPLFGSYLLEYRSFQCHKLLRMLCKDICVLKVPYLVNQYSYYGCELKNGSLRE